MRENISNFTIALENKDMRIEQLSSYLKQLTVFFSSSNSAVDRDTLIPLLRRSRLDLVACAFHVLLNMP
jgi:hypothetical protein